MLKTVKIRHTLTFILLALASMGYASSETGMDENPTYIVRECPVKQGLCYLNSLTMKKNGATPLVFELKEKTTYSEFRYQKIASELLKKVNSNLVNDSDNEILALDSKLEINVTSNSAVILHVDTSDKKFVALALIDDSQTKILGYSSSSKVVSDMPQEELITRICKLMTNCGY